VALTVKTTVIRVKMAGYFCYNILVDMNYCKSKFIGIYLLTVLVKETEVNYCLV
jgi:hypothetical protein